MFHAKVNPMTSNIQLDKCRFISDTENHPEEMKEIRLLRATTVFTWRKIL